MKELTDNTTRTKTITEKKRNIFIHIDTYTPVNKEPIFLFILFQCDFIIYQIKSILICMFSI